MEFLGSIPSIINNEENLYEGNIKHYFKLLFNSRSSFCSYHGIRHSLEVFYKCYSAIKWELENYDGFSKYRVRHLLIAALLHDLDHRGRSGNDDLNIEAALRLIKPNIQEGDSYTYIEFLVRSTEYGASGHIHESTSEIENILRDADISQVLAPSWIRIVLFGLSEEMGVKPFEMLINQEKFLSNIRFESRWGQAILQPQIPAKIEECQRLIEILS